MNGEFKRSFMEALTDTENLDIDKHLDRSLKDTIITMK